MPRRNVQSAFLLIWYLPHRRGLNWFHQNKRNFEVDECLYLIPVPIMAHLVAACKYRFIQSTVFNLIRLNCFSCAPDRDFLCFYPCEIFLPHTPVPALGKDGNEQLYAGCTSIRDVIVMLKCRHHVDSQSI